jgi:signal transduction histidine kinase
MSLVQQFIASMALAVAVTMATAGYWAEKRLFQNAISSMAETSALYLEGFLEPHVQRLASSGGLDVDDRKRIDALLDNPRLAGRVEAIKIWSLDGELIHSTDRARQAEAAPGSARETKDALRRAAAGEVAVDFEGHGEPWRAGRARRVEIYAPIHASGTRTPIAVGEFYENVAFLDDTIAYYRATMWASLIVFTLIIIGLISAIVVRASRTIQRQQRELRDHFATASRLARRNDRLRRIADAARLNAAVANESYLARIGADLHDGPVQVLGLASLKLSDMPATGDEAIDADLDASRQLVGEAIRELRELATGLVLPEIATCSLPDAIRMVVGRHEAMTGTRVASELGVLPEQASLPLKVCVYRVLQEGLSNAYRHADGRGQSVQARLNGDQLEVSVSDAGGARPGASPDSTAPSLGLTGLINRVKALNGTCVMQADRERGFEIRVRIPI